MVYIIEVSLIISIWLYICNSIPEKNDIADTCLIYLYSRIHRTQCGIYSHCIFVTGNSGHVRSLGTNTWGTHTPVGSNSCKYSYYVLTPLGHVILTFAFQSNVFVEPALHGLYENHQWNHDEVELAYIGHDWIFIVYI